MPDRCLTDCCVDVFIPTGIEPELTIEAGEHDPFTGEELIWPTPRTYWSNGMITDGYVAEVDP